MNVRFRTRKLERCYAEYREAARTWGLRVGRRYIERVRVLQELPRWADGFTIRAWRLHPLTGNRAGRHAIDLGVRARLIVQYDESSRTVEIEEVDTTHDGD